MFERGYELSRGAMPMPQGLTTERMMPYTQADEFEKIIGLAEKCNVEKTPELFSDVFNRLYPPQPTAGENVASIVESIKPLGEMIINKIEEVGKRRSAAEISNRPKKKETRA